ncbi:MAG: phosphoribosyl-AMP cyclohydrolase, partial [Candidatus Omnitrophica bacterium]|nr:phosphoribosyl-AMP cyclohydrolase [Candidatus Omnitrophota bacterium]
TSGHFQFVKSVAYDCDCDTLLIKVEQVGCACHTMKKSCFYREIEIKK